MYMKCEVIDKSYINRSKTFKLTKVNIYMKKLYFALFYFYISLSILSNGLSRVRLSLILIICLLMHLIIYLLIYYLRAKIPYIAIVGNGIKSWTRKTIHIISILIKIYSTMWILLLLIMRVLFLNLLLHHSLHHWIMIHLLLIIVIHRI